MSYDAVVVGAGPNGLAAGIELARNGLSVLIREANETVGGSARSEELTLPGFVHDSGSAVYPLGVGSPFFSSLPLEEHGLDWVYSEAPLAHPLEGDVAVMLERNVKATARWLGLDKPMYRRLMKPFVKRWDDLADLVLGSPFRPPKHPLLATAFGVRTALPTSLLAREYRSPHAPALLAGNAAHSGIPLGKTPSAAIGLVLMIAAHAVGWPIPRGGAGRLTGALASYFQSLGGKIETSAPVRSLAELPEARVTMLALTYRQVAEIAGDGLPSRYVERLTKWRYGPGAFKVDWALSDPIPWTAPSVARATTVHVGGGWKEIVEAERAPWRGRVADRPFVLLAQPSLADPTRAPERRHTAWGYCHVPNGWTGDATEAIEAQIERFAPGFRDTIMARHTRSPADLEAWNANLVGGDVNGGAITLGQLLGPTRWTRDPWATPVPNLYICSASTPPGGGVHGMAGYHAARSALRRHFGIR